MILQASGATDRIDKGGPTMLNIRCLSKKRTIFRHFFLEIRELESKKIKEHKL